MDPLRNLKKVSRFFGFDPIVLRDNVKGLGFFKEDLAELKRQRGSDNTFSLGPYRPILNERQESAGNMSGHYFHQDLHVARRIFQAAPALHLDIGSRIDGFVAHVAAFRSIEILDIRPLVSTDDHIRFRQADLMVLPADMLGYTDSISSLHAIEHFGLGRYSDPIDYNGHRKAIDNIAKILRPGGKFYFSVPIGPSRIEFNAHRVFSIPYLLEIIEPDYEVLHFSYVDDRGNFHPHAPLADSAVHSNYGCNYGCGIFELERRRDS